MSMHDHISMTSIKLTEKLNHPPPNLTNTETITFLLGLSEHGGQIYPQKLENEHGIFLLAPEVLMQRDDVWRAPKELQRFDFSGSRLVTVNLLEGEDEFVGETTGSVDVGVGSGAHPFHDLMLRNYLRSGMDAPLLVMDGPCPNRLLQRQNRVRKRRGGYDRNKMNGSEASVLVAV